MAEKTKGHKADVFAGKGSFSDMLKKNRESVESGAYADADYIAGKETETEYPSSGDDSSKKKPE